MPRSTGWWSTSSRTGRSRHLATQSLIAHRLPDGVVAYRAGRPIHAAQFLADVERVGQALGAGRHVLNSCIDRYRFAVGFAATLARGQVSVLPPAQTPEAVRQIVSVAPDVVCLTDDASQELPLPRVLYPPDEIPVATATALTGGATLRDTIAARVPEIDAARHAADVFTSGSTGAPLAHNKSWGRLTAGAREMARQLGLAADAPFAIVATVPPQHMFGFESSVLLALCAGHALCAERPFFPADIAAVLGSVPRPRLLITTPVHLRALLAAEVALPPTDLIVSSTAPLTPELAREAEQRFLTRLLEIYGSTETGAIACRRPTHGLEWRSWPGIRLSQEGEATWAQGGHLERPTRLCDLIEITASGRFLLHGRLTDLVNIAGKRSSLGYLNHQLNSIPGVEDGAFFHVDESRASHTGVARLAACVVAPGLDAARLLEALRRRIDAVFLPRPLLFVAQLPRSATGKLPAEALRALATARE